MRPGPDQSAGQDPTLPDELAVWQALAEQCERIASAPGYAPEWAAVAGQLCRTVARLIEHMSRLTPPCTPTDLPGLLAEHDTTRRSR